MNLRPQKRVPNAMKCDDEMIPWVREYVERDLGDDATDGDRVLAKLFLSLLEQGMPIEDVHAEIERRLDRAKEMVFTKHRPDMSNPQ